jgi:hypothetical protein
MKYLKSKFLIIIAFIFAWAPAAQAGLFKQETADEIKKRGDQFGSGVGFASEQSPGATIAFLINAFLGLLGIIFIIIIIVAGFNWMTAGGEEEKIRKSKTKITRAVIGLLIVLSAYAITYFVFRNLPMGDAGPV